MNYQLFRRFSPVIKTLSPSDLDDAVSLRQKLLLEKDGQVEVCYAPFEYINRQAKVVIVGITPGQLQMVNALREARIQLMSGAGDEQALVAAKQTGAFSGAIRPNLIALLDSIGLHKWLTLNSCGDLFGASAGLVQTTSALRNPVFIKGKNYSGAPGMTKHPLLRDQLLKYFGEDAKQLPEAVFVPLGDKVAEALYFLADKGAIRRDRILDGLPHPSGANAERIAYFLGRKEQGALSVKTNADKLDRARTRVLEQVSRLG